MTAIDTSRSARALAARQRAERLADVFRTGRVGEAFTDDVFLDGHPPFWRFQLEGVEAVASWLAGYAPDGVETTVVHAVATESGFVTELSGRHEEDGLLLTDRKIVLCEVRGDRVAALTVYCSGDWDAGLRERHARETTLLRP